MALRGASRLVMFGRRWPAQLPIVALRAKMEALRWPYFHDESVSSCESGQRQLTLQQ
jgi:hypothetical protein